MTEAARQAKRREKLKKEGYVELRLEVPLVLRENLKSIAASKNNTLKGEVEEALNNHVDNQP